jgi:hypothetical protein
MEAVQKELNEMLFWNAECVANEAFEALQTYARKDEAFGELLRAYSDDVQMWLFDHTSASIDEDRFLDHAYKVNVMLATPNERNRDMSDYCFMNSYGDGTDQLPTDTALAWLCNQYGKLDEVQAMLKDLCAGKDVYAPIVTNDEQERRQHNFVLSVVEELDNFTHCMGGLTILASVTLRDCEAIAKEGSFLVTSGAIMLGIFNPWVGGGSLMSIVLPSGLTVPHDFISHIWVEKTKEYGYDVDEVFGIVSDAWQPVEVKNQ